MSFPGGGGNLKQNKSMKKLVRKIGNQMVLANIAGRLCNLGSSGGLPLQKWELLSIEQTEDLSSVLTKAIL